MIFVPTENLPKEYIKGLFLILSHRLSSVAISKYAIPPSLGLPTNIPPTRDHFLATWATKSKQSPWFWRRRMRVTSITSDTETIYQTSEDPTYHMDSRPPLPHSPQSHEV